jgi:glycerophosphoryl diester phosphodiesterase
MKPLFLLSGLLFLNFCLYGQQQKPMDVEAHAGGKGLYPGNSIPAFINALKLGVTTLEMDCVISKDSMVVVSHDPFMNHVFMLSPTGKQISKQEEKTHNLFKMPYDSIRQYQLGAKFDPEFASQKLVKTYKPLLGEVIDSVESYIRRHNLKPVQYNIEIKSYHQAMEMNPEPQAFANLVLAIIAEYNLQNRVLIQSFDVRPLQYIKKKYPAIKISYLLSKNTPLTLEQNLDKLGFIPQVLSPEYPMVTEEMIKTARKHKMAIIPWTIDSEADMRKYIGMGVDGIITNYPNTLLQLLSKQ